MPRVPGADALDRLHAAAHGAGDSGDAARRHRAAPAWGSSSGRARPAPRARRRPTRRRFSARKARGPKPKSSYCRARSTGEESLCDMAVTEPRPRILRPSPCAARWRCARGRKWRQKTPGICHQNDVEGASRRLSRAHSHAPRTVHLSSRIQLGHSHLRGTLDRAANLPTI